jgi:ribosomal protein S18 acetylase RimI-like enzyme
MNIKLATPAEAEIVSALNTAVQAIHAEALPHIFKPPSAETFPAAVVSEILKNSDNFIFIAYDGQNPVGYIFVEIIHHPETPRHFAMDVLHIHHISVNAAHYGQGYGQALLQEAKNFAQKRGLSMIELDVWTFNTRAREFYAKQGFRVFNERMWLEV